MALYNMKEILLDAQKRAYGVGYFNAVNLEMIRAYIEAAEELDSPIIIGTAEIDPRTCLAYRMTGCRDCYDACNYSAIELKDEGGANPIPYVVEDKCNGCGACQAACLSLSSGSIKSTERAIVVRPIEA